tara:strand:+ start:638 stop:1885 length:1248 start_codon:yes stop_codon:yes gene_type:complete
LQSNAEKQTINQYTSWLNTARPKQINPLQEENIWLILAGRGWGKTRTGAQDLALYALRNANTISAVVAPTHGDLRRTCFDGESGLLSVIPKECYRKDGTGYTSFRGEEIHLHNGSKIIGYAAIQPERLRGAQFHRAWCDELAAWRYAEAFDQLMFGLRLGENPKCVITTTPKPIPIIRNLVERKDVVVTTGNTFENQENLASTALTMFKERYEGTTLGRQELYAEILEDFEGALWNNNMIEKTRLSEDTDRELQKVIVAVDPAVTSNENSDETGIIVVGKDFAGRFYVLEDLSGVNTPDRWARIAVDAYYDFQADMIVAETNQGGDLVERLIRSVDPQIPYRSVRATRGKMVRCEPISALYEQEKVHHIGYFPELEQQMVSYTGETNSSPDRLDALVWGLTELSKSRGEVNWRIS